MFCLNIRRLHLDAEEWETCTFFDMAVKSALCRNTLFRQIPVADLGMSKPESAVEFLGLGFVLIMPLHTYAIFTKIL